MATAPICTIWKKSLSLSCLGPEWVYLIQKQKNKQLLQHKIQNHVPKLKAVVVNSSLCSSITLIILSFFERSVCEMLKERQGKREWAITKRMQHCPQSLLLFFQLTHIHEMVLRGLPMSLAQVKLDRVLARKSPVAELALIHGPTVVVIFRGGWWGLSWGQRGG